MKKILLTALAILAVSTSSANADLVLNISGLAGSGISTFEFVDSKATTSGAGTFRDNTGVTYSNNDTTQFGSVDGIFDGAIQDQLFVMTGNASITIGNFTETITGVFLDDDGVGEGDDMGFRAANPIDYSSAESVSWTGTGTINLDITAFNEGTFQMDFGNLWLIDQGNTVVNISATVIPEPSGIAVAAVFAVGLVTRRRR